MFDTCTCISCLDRARVVGGLPDVVAIQEGKVNKQFFTLFMKSVTLLLFLFSLSLCYSMSVSYL